MLAHIRLATRGTMDYENTHPFVMRDNCGRPQTLGHNGTIFDCEILSTFVKTQQGQTDSERILCYMIDRINTEQERLRRPMSQEERFRLMDEIICKITPENKVNLFVFDGELFYVHTNYKNSLHWCWKEDALVISTRPLGKDSWGQIPMNTLLAYQDGELRAPRSRQRIINSAAWYLWNTAFSKQQVKVSSDEKSQPIILQLIREGKPEGECSMLSLLSIDESLNDKVLILCI